MRNYFCHRGLSALLVLAGYCNGSFAADGKPEAAGGTILCVANWSGIFAISATTGEKKELVRRQRDQLPLGAAIFSQKRNALFYYDEDTNEILQIDASGNPPKAVYHVPPEFLEKWISSNPRFSKKEYLIAFHSLQWLQIDDQGDHLYFLLRPDQADDNLIQLDLNTGNTKIVCTMILEDERRPQWRDDKHLLIGCFRGTARKLASINIDDGKYETLPFSFNIQLSPNRKTFIDWEGRKDDAFTLYDAETLKPLKTIKTDSLAGHTSGQANSEYTLIGDRQLLLTRKLGESPGFYWGTYLLDMDTMKHRHITLQSFDAFLYTDMEFSKILKQ